VSHLVHRRPISPVTTHLATLRKRSPYAMSAIRRCRAKSTAPNTPPVAFRAAFAAAGRLIVGGPRGAGLERGPRWRHRCRRRSAAVAEQRLATRQPHLADGARRPRGP